MKAKKIVWIDSPEAIGVKNGYIGNVLAFKVSDWYGDLIRVNHFGQNNLLYDADRIENETFGTREDAETYCRTHGVKAILDLFLDEMEDNDENIKI